MPQQPRRTSFFNTYFDLSIVLQHVSHPLWEPLVQEAFRKVFVASSRIERDQFLLPYYLWRGGPSLLQATATVQAEEINSELCRCLHAGPRVTSPPAVPDSTRVGFSCQRDVNYNGACVAHQPCVLKGVATLQQCEERCARLAGCVALVFNQYGQCFLKSNARFEYEIDVEHGTVGCLRNASVSPRRGEGMRVEGAGGSRHGIDGGSGRSSRSVRRRNVSRLSSQVVLASNLLKAIGEGSLPFTRGGMQVNQGVNMAMPGIDGTMAVPHTRNWQRGAQSNSISRHLQHRFMWRMLDQYAGSMRKGARCLDWDGWYVGSVFASICHEKDVVEFAHPLGTRVQPKRLPWSAVPNATANRWYYVDAHKMAKTLEHDAYDLVIANSVFEHLRQPFTAMAQVYEVLRPGGLLLWHTPFEYERHGVPSDFFRFTAEGARSVAESVGLTVDFSEGDGGYAAVLGNMLGLGSKFWSDQQLAEGESSKQATLHYLSTRMIARKPV